jgi:N-acetylglucosamine kinase-like BadF-type ATPase
MILIADSGSTKCDWMIVENETKQTLTSTMGFNPFFHTTEFIATEIRKNCILTEYAYQINEIFFYGAGCSHPDRNQQVALALNSIFTNANVVVDHDLTGAALAACQGKPGIACILGTGSNSCFFDGKDIFEEVPALGNRLGDEGSGSYFGRKILSLFLYKRLDEEVSNYMKYELQLNKENIFENLYHKPNENVYLASFMKIYAKFPGNKKLNKILFDGIAEFADIHILCFNNYKEVPVNFVGSVAFYNQEIIHQVAEKIGFKVGNIIRQPIGGLLAYHLKTSISA